MSNLPSGTVTFVFTDIEGSTKLAHSHREALPAALARHDDIARTAFAAHGGHIIKATGDGFTASFATAAVALSAALDFQRALLAAEMGVPLRARVGIHAGGATPRPDGDYDGCLTLATAQRIMSAGHGGQILLSQSCAELVRGELRDGVALRDLGEHLLKGLPLRQRVYQVEASDLPRDFPPLATADVRKHNLPRQTTSFIGREREVAQIKAALSQSSLVTLTGVGGTGKTRLSLRVAEDVMGQYEDGAWFVELAPVRDEALVAGAVAEALGIRADGSRPLSETLLDALRAQNALIILDNCEHLIEACAELADRIVQQCPRARVLASSREALGVEGERAIRVPSLSLPPEAASLRDSLETEAVTLFVERARLASPNFDLTERNAPAVTKICRRLDGIPLAIELAAARVRAMTPEQIGARLDDRFRLLTGGSRTRLPRQQTLLAAVEWSWSLLAVDERTLLCRLSVFRGGWTLEGAEGVCRGEVLDALTRLVDKSLVILDDGTGRYRLLETIQQFARDRLFESGDGEAAREAHNAWFAQFAEDAVARLFGARYVEIMRSLDAEHDNLRAALVWALDGGHGAKALRLTASLSEYWYQRAFGSESLDLLKRTLAQAPEEPVSVEERRWLARTLWGASIQASAMGMVTGSLDYIQRSVQHWRVVGDEYELAWALTWHANRIILYSQYEAVEEVRRNALELAISTKNSRALGFLFSQYSGLSSRAGNFARAAELSERSVQYAREAGNPVGLFQYLANRANLDIVSGDKSRAEARALEALEILRSIGRTTTNSNLPAVLARLAIQRDDRNTARAILREYAETSAKAGMYGYSALNMLAGAELALSDGNTFWAARSLGFLTSLPEYGAMSGNPWFADGAARVRAAAQSALGDTAFAAALEEGKKVTLAEAFQMLREV